MNENKCKMNLTPLEHDEQVTLFQWAEWNFGRYPELRWMFAIANGGLRNKIVAKKLKAEGVKKGVPDVFLSVPRRGYNGLYIEMKRQQGSTTSEAQKEWHTALRQYGYRVDVCQGFEKAKEALENYLK